MKNIRGCYVDHVDYGSPGTLDIAGAPRSDRGLTHTPAP